MIIRNVGHFTQCQLLLASCSTHFTNNDQPSMNPYTDGELDTFLLLQTGIEVSHGSKNSQTSSYCSLGVIFVSHRKAEVDQETIAKVLGDMPIVALDDLGTHPLIGTDHVPILFGVELVGESSGVHQVTEHHRELAAFGVRYGRGRWRTTRLWGRDLL